MSTACYTVLIDKFTSPFLMLSLSLTLSSIAMMIHRIDVYLFCEEPSYLSLSSLVKHRLAAGDLQPNSLGLFLVVDRYYSPF